MIYQQEVRAINEFYDRYKDKKIVYSKEVSKSIGIVQRETSVKVGSHILKGALISSTMESFVVMARLTENLKQAIYDVKGALVVQLTFLDRETGKSMLFTIHTKFLNLNNQGLGQKDLQFVAMQIRRKIPNDLIKIFGQYHEEAAVRLKNKKNKVECLLLANESKVDALTVSISKNELVLDLKDSQAVSLNSKAIAILKIINTGEVLEIIGTVLRKVDDSGGGTRISLHYTMEDQSPRFGYSIHVLRNLINS